MNKIIVFVENNFLHRKRHAKALTATGYEVRDAGFFASQIRELITTDVFAVVINVDPFDARKQAFTIIRSLQLGTENMRVRIVVLSDYSPAEIRTAYEAQCGDSLSDHRTQILDRVTFFKQVLQRIQPI